MGRRRREPSLGEVLAESPWWVPAALAAGSYVVFHAVIPAFMASNPFLAGVSSLFRGFAWVPATIFSFMALIAYVRNRRRGAAAPVSREPAVLRGRSGGPPAASGTIREKSTEKAGRAEPSMSPSANQNDAAKPTEWSVGALQQLEWKRFEMLCVWYYEAMGFNVATVSHGPDGGIDATLYREGMSAPLAVVQCKAWRSAVKVETVRALGGAMHAKQVRRGVFWSLTGFLGQPVKDYAAEAGIQLLDGEGIVERIRALDQYKRATLLAKAFKGDYRTPTCAACGVKLVERKGKAGLFWGCRNYSKGCRVTLPRVG